MPNLLRCYSVSHYSRWLVSKPLNVASHGIFLYSLLLCLMHLGQSTVKTLSNSNGSRPTIYAYPVQSTSQAGPQQVSQLPSTEGTSSVTTPGTQPPVAILQTALSGDYV